mmetsp:Transcript_143908/g.261826  ORF Transcript_143908/g.261826 Transcript_143908/m.261826 type:complete len:772 (-) Transcript_143908:56-2371(-)
MPPISDAVASCCSQAEDVQRVLGDVDTKWRKLEERLETVTEQVLRDHLDDLSRWFGVDEAAIANFAESGFRWKTRDRVQKLLLAPLTETVRQRVTPPGNASDEGLQSHVMDVLQEYWEKDVEPKLREATTADQRWTRKQRRLNKMVSGIRDPTGDAQRQRQAIWAPAEAAVKLLAPSTQALAEFAAESLSDEAIARLAAAVPAIVARSVCDWHFHCCTAEFAQLDSWWEGARAALQSRTDVWELLLEEEGLFLRRLERGIEELRAERTRYATLATFGHARDSSTSGHHGSGDWPAEGAALLAQAVMEMRRRLKPIRDSAAWRVVDAAKAIQKRLAEDAEAKQGPWKKVSRDDGIKAICEALQIGVPKFQELQLLEQPGAALSCLSADPEDVALDFAQRLDRFVALVAELQELPSKEAAPDTGGFGYILDEVLQFAAYLQEDLLSVLDDANAASLGAWLQEWREWGDADAGRRLESAMLAMPLKKDAALSHQEMKTRQNQLALLRGVQAALEDKQLRVWLMAPAAPSDALVNESDGLAVTGPASSTADIEVIDISLAIPARSPAPTPELESPRNSYPLRRPESHNSTWSSPIKTNGLSEQVQDAASPLARTARAVDLGEAAITDSAPISPERAFGRAIDHFSPTSLDVPLSPKDFRKSGSSSRKVFSGLRGEAGVRARSDTSGRRGGSAASPPREEARPMTPSWLDPPWPRCHSPASLWSRPGTPAGATDEPEALSMPKWKFIDGQCVPLRPASSSKRLPPLTSMMTRKAAW